jgi:hypothetical protein
MMEKKEVQSDAFAKRLQQKGYDAVIPKPGGTISL